MNYQTASSTPSAASDRASYVPTGLLSPCWVSVIAVSIIGMATNHALGQDKKSQVEQPPVLTDNVSLEGERLIVNMLLNRQIVVNGVVEIHGQETSYIARFGSFERDVKLFCAFDIDRKAFRFDRKATTYRIIKSGSESNPDAIRKFEQAGWYDGKYARNIQNAYSLNYKYNSSEPETVAVYGRERKPLQFLQAFDWRIFGLCTHADLFQGTEYEDLVATLRSQQITDVTWATQSIAKVQLRAPVKGAAVDFNRTLWIDTSKGFTPIRQVYEDPKRPGHNLVSDTNAVNVSGVWVPSSFRIEDRISPNANALCEYMLNWASVNNIDHINANYFNEKGFDLSNGTRVVDLRTGKPIIIRIVGNTHVSANAPNSITKGRSLARNGLVLLNIFAFIVLAAIVLIRKFKHRKS